MNAEQERANQLEEMALGQRSILAKIVEAVGQAEGVEAAKVVAQEIMDGLPKPDEPEQPEPPPPDGLIVEGNLMTRRVFALL